MRFLMLYVVAGFVVAGAILVMRAGTRLQAVALGAALIAVGAPLVAVSRRQLGDSFTVGPQAKRLVTHGMYTRIPHPMYVFLDVTLAGIIVLTGAPWLFAALAALVVLQTWQARREARVLRQAFGHEYRAYRARTWW